MPPGTVNSANKSCHSCRRNRWRCDRTYPHCRKCASRGIDCLGYGQLFMWTGAVASRGKLAGKTSSAALYGSEHKDKSATRGNWEPEQTNDDATGAEAEMQLTCRASTVSPLPSSPWVLADPLYQDMDNTHRYYLSYFSSRVCLDLVANDSPEINPFRHLLSLTKTHPLMLHVLVAASAAHMSNSAKPLVNYSLRKNGGWLRDPFLKDALIAKHKALQLMPAALENIDSIGSDMVLAAVLFLINVELIESGRHGWRPHLQGACQIMNLIQPTTVLNQTLREYIFSDCFVYYILASAFMPVASKTPTYFQASQVLNALKKAETNSYFCCPPEILEVLLLASQLSNQEIADADSTDRVVAAGADLLQRAQDVDIYAWAHRIHSIYSFQSVSIESRIQAGLTHRLSACIYTLQAVPELEAQVPVGFTEALVNEFFNHLARIPEEDPNFKATAWTTFIAGAAATKSDQRAWAMERLKRLGVLVPWGFIYTAMDILQDLWKLDEEGKSPRSWIQTLKDPSLNFLIV